MKSSKPKYDHHSCCVIIKQRAVYHEDGPNLEPDLAMGWIIDDATHDLDAQRQMCDALEQLGFTDGLARRV